MSFLNGQVCYLVSRQAIDGKVAFAKTADYEFFLSLLKKHKARHRIKILGFCILPKAFFLVLYMSDTALAINFLREVCKSYSIYGSVKYPAPADSWFKRHRLVILETDHDVFDAIKHIEFLPVRFSLTDSPLNYPWSSCSYRVLDRTIGFLDSDIVSTLI